MRRKQQAFTLIELLIVIAIIALLADIMIPNFVRARSEGQLSSCESNERNMGTACEMYCADNQGHYESSLTVLTPNYIKIIPTCPAAGTDTYDGTYSFVSTETGQTIDAYSFYCSGTWHISVLELSNYPQYVSDQGLISGH